ncbi:GDP-fucose transporter 1-like [Watersipora subatra]|uniref:GDP-fucose transporter 1-like n=1 Tax=Watersipora subatra TaxID=2589382 RepID=UPI00355B7B8E
MSDAEEPNMDSLFKRSLKIASVVAAYWVVSISLVFLNKHLLSGDDVKLDAPLFITWFQCIVTILLCWIFSVMSRFWPNAFSFPEFKIDVKVSREVLPLSFMFVMMISFNNLCLKYVDVSFYYIGRSLTTVFNVICTYVILGQTTSIKALLCCGVIIGGFFLGVDQEKGAGSLSIVGVFFGVSASLCVALNAILTKRTLPAVDNNVWRLTLYNNINGAIIFLPLIVIFGEIPTIYKYQNIASPSFWGFMAAAGIAGFAIGYVTGLQIQVTSPLTHNVSGTAKACAQTVMGSVWFKEERSGMWWFSNGVVLFGSFMYTIVKRSELAKSKSDDKKVPDIEPAKSGDDTKSLLPK